MLLPISRRRDFRFGSSFYAAALLILFVAYSAVLALTGNSPVSRVLANALANVVPIALLGLAARQAVRKLVAGRPLATQILAHAALAAALTLLWFWLLMVILGAIGGRSPIEFSVRPFFGPAAAWQLFQGITIYAAIAVAAHAEILVERTSAPAPQLETAPPAAHPLRLFVRHEDEIRPLDTDRIILVRGADDYSEIMTATGTHLVRVTLATLDDRLGDRFVRVHRSYLVNVARISRVEPEGGGRMLVHMDGGETVRTSRAGSKLLRERII